MYGPPPGPPMPPPAPRRMSPLLIVPLVVGAVVVVAVLLALIGAVAGDPDATETPAGAATSGSAPTTRAASSSPGAQAAAPARVPEPTAQQRRAYLAAIARIDPGLAVNKGRAMRRAGRICERIVLPGGTRGLERYTVLELSGGNATINEAQARQVIKAVHVWCQPR